VGKIPVIIPFYRETEKLSRCVEHVSSQTYPEIAIFVRDNTHDNVYFTAAVNEGLRKFCYNTSVQYVVILNQDAYLAPNAIYLLADFLDRNPQSAIAAPLQLTSEGLVSWGGSLRAFPFGQHRKDPLESYDRPTETYWANGAALMLRTEVVRDVGLWDRNFRFICSDTDFSFSARARGWKVHVVPGARCEHSVTSSTRGANLEIELIKLMDMIYFARKWASGALYRELSFEGPTITELAVRQDIDNMQRIANELNRRILATSAVKELP